MTIVVVSATDVALGLRDRGIEVLELDSGVAIERELRPVLASVDAIVVGRDVSDPIQTAQRAYRLDPILSVVLLAGERQAQGLRTGLRFAPFVGSDVYCEDVNADGDLLRQIQGAAERTRARRNHRQRLSSVNTALTQERRASSPPIREQFVVRVLDTMPVGIMAVDAERRVLSVNREMSRLLERTERDLLGHPVVAAAFGATESALAALFGATQRGDASDVFLRGDGQAMELRIVALTDGGTKDGFLLIGQDVTERLRAGEAKTAALRRMEEASRLKDEFIAMVSHELRTPMTAILGWARILRARSDEPAKMAHALDVIERNAVAQSKLIEDLLDFSRIISGKMRLEVRPTALEVVVHEAADSVRIAAAAKGVALAIDIAPSTPEVLGDADRLRQVVWNLLSNAVKFTPRGGTVRVRADQAESAVGLHVEDDGEGIDPALLPFLFEPFRQGEGSASPRHGGLGLGLAIARRLMELHGGKLIADSAGIGRGARFTVFVPISAVTSRVSLAEAGTETTPVAPFASDAGALANARILVVDDNADARDFVAVVLTEAGAQVWQAPSAAAALEQLHKHAFDVLLSDIGMPDEDGYALIARVRKRERDSARRIHAIALTAYARAADRAHALRAGFDEYAAKPIDPSTLVALVQTVIGRA